MISIIIQILFSLSFEIIQDWNDLMEKKLKYSIDLELTRWTSFDYYQIEHVSLYNRFSDVLKSILELYGIFNNNT